jgi:hypothetical protein
MTEFRLSLGLGYAGLPAGEGKHSAGGWLDGEPRQERFAMGKRLLLPTMSLDVSLNGACLDGHLRNGGFIRGLGGTDGDFYIANLTAGYRGILHSKEVPGIDPYFGVFAGSATGHLGQDVNAIPIEVGLEAGLLYYLGSGYAVFIEARHSYCDGRYCGGVQLGFQFIPGRGNVDLGYADLERSLYDYEELLRAVEIVEGLTLSDGISDENLEPIFSWLSREDMFGQPDLPTIIYYFRSLGFVLENAWRTFDDNETRENSVRLAKRGYLAVAGLFTKALEVLSSRLASSQNNATLQNIAKKAIRAHEYLKDKPYFGDADRAKWESLIQKCGTTNE